MDIRQKKADALIERWANAIADLAAAPYEGDKRDAQARIVALQGAINEAAGTPEQRAVEHAQLRFEDSLGHTLHKAFAADDEIERARHTTTTKDIITAMHAVKVPE